MQILRFRFRAHRPFISDQKTCQKISRIFLRSLFFLSILLLTACKAELFTDLVETDANEMLSVLLKNGIDAEKIPGKKGMVSLAVEKNELSNAISILRDYGYPRESFANLGQIFNKDSLISSPLEERARYIYAVSQEIAQTLVNVDGVITARVHVVLPEEDASGEIKTPSSASIFIKHSADVNMQPYVPQIKMLVNNSIEGLEYEKISVALFPAKVSSADENGKSTELLAKSELIRYLYIGISVLGGLLLIAMGLAVFFYLRSRAATSV